MNRNIFKLLLLILLAISFVKPAKASIKPLEISPNKAFICCIWDYDPDEEGEAYSYNEVIVYGPEGIFNYINNLHAKVEFSCRPYKNSILK